jgi:hypothetical protein
MRKELFFKASRKKSESFGDYRKILKSWDDLALIDEFSACDDVIWIRHWWAWIRIDCDKKTGVFRLFID